MTNEEIKALLELEAKVTKGPWSLEVEEYEYAELIAAARNAIRPLAEEVLRLREEVALLHEEIGGCDLSDDPCFLDPRIRYATIQVDKEVYMASVRWLQARSEAKK